MTPTAAAKTEERVLDEPSFPVIYVTDLLKSFV